MPDPTPNLGLERPDFNVVTWHDQINGNFTTLDAILAGLFGNLTGTWENSRAYTVGQLAADPELGSLWQVSTAHTSAASGTFAADRAGAASGKWVQVLATTTKNVRVVTAAGAVTVTNADDIVLINKTVGAPTTVNLAAAATFTRPIKIVDLKGDAGTNPITIDPNGAETIVGLSTWVIGNNQGSIEITANPTGTGWYI